MVEPPKTLVQPGLKDLLLNTLRVEVVSGPDRGKQTTSPSEVLSLGTAADNSVALTDFTVSRYHLELTRRREGVQVVDLGSTNGTFLGAVRVERAIVPPGTTLKLGASTVRIDDAVERQVELHPTDRLHDLRGASPEMLRLFAEIERVARGSASVLVHGESGTGKELIAEALHASSPRTGQPFITVDCGSLPSTLLASELFGHERGSFTGADRQHIGAFEAAGNGTVFLDEIGEMPAADQSTLLGVLERRRFRRVGGREEIEVGARVVAATNRDLRTEVNTGRFRLDLYYRLAVVVLRVPPLRERREDIPLLIEHITRQLGHTEPVETLLSPEIFEAFMRHPWPGNVRELRNAVEAALLLGTSPIGIAPIGASAPVPLRTAAAGGATPAAPATLSPYKDARARVVHEFETTYLADLLERAGGNVSAAARLAQMDRSHLIDLLRRHDLRGK
ncbi:MAG: sigma 54-dependent Fis family transcriptional regulator [Kofleriaceae bacterium]|jgi:DNA-binding NtrC family response regulator|nr:sigma 54-dependent Fis family transcriptional regulator [Kofleriaceae bacterium]MBP6839179.1 sigma 54-dependent Fis family transcriptional regulator [Kofleriaceae bacterium]